MYRSFSTADVELLVWGYKYTREIARRMQSFRGEVSVYHPKFTPGSNAALIDTGTPFAIDDPPIVYTGNDDEAIVQYVRAQGALAFAFTCYMKLTNGPQSRQLGIRYVFGFDMVFTRGSKV